MDQIGLSGEITVVRSRLVRDAVGFSEMVRFVPIRSAFDSRFPIRAMIPTLWGVVGLVGFVDVGLCMLEHFSSYLLNSYCFMSRMSMEWRKQLVFRLLSRI